MDKEEFKQDASATLGWMGRAYGKLTKWIGNHPDATFWIVVGSIVLHIAIKIMWR